MKTYFVYDKETGYIISGFDCCEDNQKDGYNIYTRPYKYPEFHPRNENCRMDYLFNSAKREGLKNLKKENLVVAVTNSPHDVKCHFIKNPDYFNSREAVQGWWKLDNPVPSL